jgi:gamma-glutamyltranspeptidase/glutathione hydrolase
MRALPLILAAVAIVSAPAIALFDPASLLSRGPRAPVVAARHMVVAANPYAAEAGREILRAGGSAADAAIATQLVLNLVEPQSSGIGGGAFVLYWNAATNDLRAFDGREAAPAAAKPDRFLENGAPMPFEEAVRSGLSVGVPGLVRLMETVHKRYGKLPWQNLFDPAIRLAENGFVVSPRLNRLLAAERAENFAPAARSYFFDAGGEPLAAGKILKNPEFAATLRQIASGGADAFYRGKTAQEIIAALAAAPRASGGMTLEDLAGYNAKERTPVCIPYRIYKVCGMGPPSSGGLTVAQTLKLIEPSAIGSGSSEALAPHELHLIGEAEKLAYADRDRYLGDPDFVVIPDGLLDARYLSQRRSLIAPLSAMEKAEPGRPPGLARQSYGADSTIESAGTSHISIIDDAGNALSMTTTIESGFGSHIWAGGFLLNNELTDFSFRPVDAEGRPVANAVAPGKRPRSSMAPTIVFDGKGAPVAVLGSPGGGRIILYAVKSLVALLDWDLDAQASADLLNFGSQGRGFEIEPRSAALWRALMLKRYGHTIVPTGLASGTHIIVRRKDHLEGGADSRREGIAAGD